MVRFYLQKLVRDRVVPNCLDDPEVLHTEYRELDSQEFRRSLWSLIVGYALFIVPTTFVNIIDPSTITGIPSIMCGFAVLMAVALAGKVLPEYTKQK